jgi:transcription initiation factor TFIIIB Brf1 subunit/transcription initiation factor TFIIB
VSLDEGMVRMIAEAYDETVAEALAQGHSHETAHREGVTAAAMFLASMTGQEDATARQVVESLGLSPN